MAASLPKQRIPVLDGLWGFAILLVLVLVFHAVLGRRVSWLGFEGPLERRGQALKY